MHRAVNEGAICTPENMAMLYPVFREINIEMDEEKKRIDEEERDWKAEQLPLITTANETPFIPLADAPTISDVPHSKPVNKRIHKPKIAKRPAKPAKQDKKNNNAN